jgi:hypothetical protein
MIGSITFPTAWIRWPKTKATNTNSPKAPMLRPFSLTKVRKGGRDDANDLVSVERFSYIIRLISQAGLLGTSAGAS